MVRSNPNPTKSPKGLFDPYYVPEKLLHRDREMDTVSGVYKDSFEDEYGINCLVHGISGVGMTVFSRYFLTKLVPQSFNAHTVYVDAKQTKSILAIRPKPPFRPVFRWRLLVKGLISVS